MRSRLSLPGASPYGIAGTSARSPLAFLEFRFSPVSGTNPWTKLGKSPKSPPPVFLDLSRYHPSLRSPLGPYSIPDRQDALSTWAKRVINTCLQYITQATP